MKAISSDTLRSLFLEFFKSKGHALLPSASVIPENDPTVLFTTAGMHPLVPYLLGEKHPAGTRLANVQKCIRTGDIDEVGDSSHCTFFEMLGNWSLGDYFKKEAISWSFEFLTSPDYLGIDLDRLAFSVFAGDDDAPRDMESYQLWVDQGVSPDRIFFLPKKNNWWGPAGQTGPCGPDTEMFVDTGKEPCSPTCSPACDCGKYLEIWNDVFMQYNKQADGSFIPLAQKNVDTGMGLERTVCILQGKDNVYDTDLFIPILQNIERLSAKAYGQDEQATFAMRIVSDHLRTATMMLGDRRGVTPSNVDQGYVLRRLIRRAVRFGMNLGMAEGFTAEIAKGIVAHYKAVYPEIGQNEDFILKELLQEEQRFAKTLLQGTKEFEKIIGYIPAGGRLSGKATFRLYDTFGFPIEFTVELARERGFSVDVEGAQEAFRKHQELSKAGAEQRFKGGLADSTEDTTRLHSATHLLQAALRQVLGDEVAQKGSNITPERLRFDFSFSRKMMPEEIAQVQDLVNEAISRKLPITCEEMTVEQAKDKGAMGLFESKYGERVKVYTIGDVSCEICGGPHAENTSELGEFVIKKEESSSAGVRRIKAVLK